MIYIYIYIYVYICHRIIFISYVNVLPFVLNGRDCTIVHVMFGSSFSAWKLIEQGTRALITDHYKE